MPEAQLQELLSEVDRDNNGRIDVDEVCTYCGDVDGVCVRWEGGEGGGGRRG